MQPDSSTYATAESDGQPLSGPSAACEKHNSLQAFLQCRLHTGNFLSAGVTITNLTMAIQAKRLHAE
eukprot:10398544-Prorocentrum_lima.AAC.1